MVKTIELVSAVTSRSKHAGRLVRGERDEYLQWLESVTSRGEFDGPLFEAPGDPESSMLRHHSAMVIQAENKELEDELAQGRNPVGVFTIGERVLAGAFTFSPESSDRFYEATLGIGQEAVAGTIATRMQDNTLVPLSSAARIDANSGQPGVPYSQLREQFPAAVWL